jgi:hypothetical protein
MSVTIYEHADFTGNVGYFPDPASTPNLGNYAMGDSGYSWNDQVSPSSHRGSTTSTP